MKNHFVTKARGSHITVSRGPTVINGGDGSTLCPIQGRRLIACAIRLIHCPNDGVSAPLDTGWSGGPGPQPESPPDTLTAPTLHPRPSTFVPAEHHRVGSTTTPLVAPVFIFPAECLNRRRCC